MNRLRHSIQRIAPPETCSGGRIISYLIPIVLIIVSSVGLIVATGNASSITPPALLNLIPTLDRDSLNDPYSGRTTDVAKWDNFGASGLSLDLLNALDDSWQNFFMLAVADWDVGSPDSLSLYSERIDYEFECAPVAGKVKVCNGDYGEVNWRGINEAVLENGFITASAARMNEFYLQHEGDDARQVRI